MAARTSPPWLAHGVAALAALVLHLVLWEASYETFSRSIDFNRGALEDFMGPYYGTARGLAEGRGPAPGFLYGPFFALLLAPLGRLSAAAASWIWLGIELVATATLIALAVRIVRPRSRALSAAHTFVALTSFPLVHNLHWGQVGVPLAAAVLAGIDAHLRGRPRLAGWLFGAAAAVKGYPALFVVVSILGGQWRLARHALGAVLFLGLALPSLVLGLDVTLSLYGHALSGVSAAAGAGGAWSEAPNQQLLGAVLARWLGVESPIGRALAVGAGVAWAGLNLVLVRRRAESGGRAGRIEAYVLVALSVPLVVSPCWPHYLALLPFTQLSLATARGAATARAALLASVVLSSALFFRAVGDPEAYGRAGWLLVAHLALLPVVYRRERWSSTAIE